MVHTGKAAKYIGKLGFKLARNFASDDPKSLPNSKPVEEDAESFSGDKKVANHIRAMVAANDGSVWVAFKAGRLERYQFNGRLMGSKVCCQSNLLFACNCMYLTTIAASCG